MSDLVIGKMYLLCKAHKFKRPTRIVDSVSVSSTESVEAGTYIVCIDFDPYDDHWWFLFPDGTTGCTYINEDGLWTWTGIETDMLQRVGRL